MEKTSKTSAGSSKKKSGGRPKGVPNKGGPLINRITDKAEKNTLGFLQRQSHRMGKWAAQEPDSENKDMLTQLSAAFGAAFATVSEEAIPLLKELTEKKYVPPKVATAAIDYTPERQVWIKSAVKQKYLDMDYTEEDLNKLYVVKVSGGKLMVSIGKGSRYRIPVPKLHIAVREPAGEGSVAA